MSEARDICIALQAMQNLLQAIEYRFPVTNGQVARGAVQDVNAAESAGELGYLYEHFTGKKYCEHDWQTEMVADVSLGCGPLPMIPTGREVCGRCKEVKQA